MHIIQPRLFLTLPTIDIKKVAHYLKSKKMIFFLMKISFGIAKENHYCAILRLVQGERIIKVSILKQTKERVHFVW